jgi:hypothetical protein
MLNEGPGCIAFVLVMNFVAVREVSWRWHGHQHSSLFACHRSALRNDSGIVGRRTSTCRTRSTAASDPGPSSSRGFPSSPSTSGHLRWLSPTQSIGSPNASFVIIAISSVQTSSESSRSAKLAFVVSAECLSEITRGITPCYRRFHRSYDR